MSAVTQDWPLHCALLLILIFSLTWFNFVSQLVPDPYLDEFFHVPQAQKYCDGDYTWDPKITTPPGLYLIAKLMKPVFGCGTNSLRALNVLASCLICFSSFDILRLLRVPPIQQQGKAASAKERARNGDQDSSVLLDANTALNIALFPPLFFFSALFYTDVMSTLAVLLSYNVFLRKKTASGSFFDNIVAVLIGIVALLFRQTNIFWVAVFPAGLAVTAALEADLPSAKCSRSSNASEVLQKCWKDGSVHDCAVGDAAFQDYVFLPISLALAALRTPLLVLRVTVPYLILLALFAGFVLWNGSVVLGDKSAHTATIHLPQMLYIWPYMAFFAAPLVVGPLLYAAIQPLPKQVQIIAQNNCLALRKPSLPDFIISGLFVTAAFVAVHFNTIVHPYTLADNRHYVFYVFRILRRHPIIKYLAVPAYYICAWLVTNALGVPSNDEQALKQKRENARPTSRETARLPCQISFLTIWLATTALSVVTAPLVEPRYFIIPFIIWRLHVQAAPASLSTKWPSNGSWYDSKLALEMLWLLVINVVIMYTFLYRGFTWPSEPGKVQRFLW
ncbi:alpha-2-glucosyltransferase Alg10 [Phaeosphaeria sp. MPI-PUGE-AT-0046c]|nr:alpha-2-glucosyltransferase Alg10 [Phaeosphaeria sp. MPI-PUGE-AT-0046c]